MLSCGEGRFHPVRTERSIVFSTSSYEISPLLLSSDICSRVALQLLAKFRSFVGSRIWHESFQEIINQNQGPAINHVYKHRELNSGAAMHMSHT
jgi:hypothetical protein